TRATTASTPSALVPLFKPTMRRSGRWRSARSAASASGGLSSLMSRPPAGRDPAPSRGRPDHVAEAATGGYEAALGLGADDVEPAHDDRGLHPVSGGGEQRLGGPPGQLADEAPGAGAELGARRDEVDHARPIALAEGDHRRRRDRVQRELGGGAGLWPRRAGQDLAASVEQGRGGGSGRGGERVRRGVGGGAGLEPRRAGEDLGASVEKDAVVGCDPARRAGDERGGGAGGAGGGEPGGDERRGPRGRDLVVGIGG